MRQGDYRDANDLSSRDWQGGKSPSAFRTITEVSTELELPQHVLRFWETKFPQIKPVKRRGGRRYYRPEDIELIRRIRSLLYVEKYTIKGVQKLLREGGIAEKDETASVLDHSQLVRQPDNTNSDLIDILRRELVTTLRELEELRTYLGRRKV